MSFDDFCGCQVPQRSSPLFPGGWMLAAVGRLVNWFRQAGLLRPAHETPWEDGGMHGTHQPPELHFWDVLGSKLTKPKLKNSKLNHQLYIADNFEVSKGTAISAASAVGP